ncbi:Phage tail protein [compost metagenome]
MVKNITIRDSLYFEFAGVRSKTLRMLNVNLDGGMQSEYFAASQSINEDKTRGRSKPYFQGIEKEPLSLTVNFAFEEEWTRDELRYVRRWLTEPNYYSPLIFSNDPEKIYYAIYIDEPELLHNSVSQGYITLNFRCNDAYAYSPLMLSPLYDWDESPLTITKNDFSSGELNGVVLDLNNRLTLSTTSLTWIDMLPNGATWNDIFA